MSKEKGILLLALGNSAYGRMAAVLAATIKATGTAIPIHLAYTESAIRYLTDNEKALFDSMAIIPEKYYTWNGQAKWIMAKVFMYQLSPFEHTLYLDCDIVWLKKLPDEIFTNFAATDLTYANSGVQASSMWADTEEIKAAYNVDKVLGIHSEFMCFKKNKTVKHFFSVAQDTYKHLKIDHTTFAGAIPDELPIMIAAELTGMMPHQQPYFPVFWYKRDKKMLHSYQIAKDYYGISMGGNYNMQDEITMYNNLAAAAYYKLGLKFPYQWKQKKYFLAERQTY